ncbi:MAG: PSD1 and planctomycete cytochrome C domain-containing protein [Planctomycetota bacterium]|nr:PSD1 and planctomycete cytochrome C domain-containing protein [Planctomycetota bacterium]
MTHPIPLVLLFCTGALAAPQETARLSFNRSIRPVLAESCFPCHGPDGGARKAGLRLDRREDAITNLPSGNRAIVPGDPHASELLRRLHHHDPADRMPPVDSGRTISKADIGKLERWISEGAPWERHWAFIPPRRSPMPAATTGATARRPIDAFITARLEYEGIAPSPPADLRTLARRLSIDLTGLPPSVDDVDTFAAAAATDTTTYERYVDGLLASPHFGERMAQFWLDLVRYADTSGYHGDQPISFWPFRDWVIRAFNDGMPFDAFTTAQLAGDLLSSPTQDQLVASGYNHLNQKTSEGGAQDKEYLAIYRADRVRTTASVWMGVTLGCAQCHDHKFDPFTAEDFYSFAAIFEDINDKGYYAGSKWEPEMRVPSPEQKRRIEELTQQITQAQARIDAETAEIVRARAVWAERERGAILKAQPPVLGPWSSAGPFFAKTFDAAYAERFGPETGAQLTWKPQPAWKDGVVHTLTGDLAATYLRRTITAHVSREVQLSLGSDDAIKVWLDGKEVFAKKVSRGAQPDQERVRLSLSKGEHEVTMKIVNGTGGYGFYFRVLRDGPPNEVVAALRVARADRSAAQSDLIATHHREIAPELTGLRAERKRLEASKAAVTNAIPTTLVSRARKPREVRILNRGDWQDESGPIVAPGGPRVFDEITPTEDRVTRLDLARWLTSGTHPLTARVFVNRIWRLFFGTGLSRSLDNLGSQGEWPVHPELLDWLAVDFVESGWDVKRLVKMMVMSAAYRRSTDPRPDLGVRDPANRLYARQSTWRLDGEFVRDNALSISGLLVRTVGGPSVKPYQPPGYWRELNFPKRVYQHDGDAQRQHRRGLYTWWQRSFLHPSLRAFDAPSREECTAERPRSNTPLQALVLLNDPSFVEAARAFAAHVLVTPASSDAERVAYAWRRAFCKAPSPAQSATLLRLLDTQRARFAKAPDAAARLVAVGVAAKGSTLDAAEHAAWTQLTRTILNLHESIVRP